MLIDQLGQLKEHLTKLPQFAAVAVAAECARVIFLIDENSRVGVSNSDALLADQAITTAERVACGAHSAPVDELLARCESRFQLPTSVERPSSAAKLRSDLISPFGTSRWTTYALPQVARQALLTADAALKGRLPGVGARLCLETFESTFDSWTRECVEYWAESIVRGISLPQSVLHCHASEVAASVTSMQMQAVKRVADDFETKIYYRLVTTVTRIVEMATSFGQNTKVDWDTIRNGFDDNQNRQSHQLQAVEWPRYDETEMSRDAFWALDNMEVRASHAGQFVAPFRRSIAGWGATSEEATMMARVALGKDGPTHFAVAFIPSGENGAIDE